LVAAARQRQMPLAHLALDEPDLAPIYEANMLLVRPDQHVCWRGNSCDDPRVAERAVATVLGFGQPVM
jgi:hypothetical protein